MKKREKIGLQTTKGDLVVTMSERNPGALDVLIRMMEKENGMFDILNLDDMNIRGSQIWVGYKDHCGEDIDSFVGLVKKRDKSLVETINNNSGSEERAVSSGASYTRGF